MLAATRPHLLTRTSCFHPITHSTPPFIPTISLPRLACHTAQHQEQETPPTMDHAGGAYPQRDSGGAPARGKGGGRGVRAYSNSSENSGSSGPRIRGQPILKSIPSQSYSTPPKQRTKAPALSLDHEYSNHSINGNNIKETFKPRPKACGSSQSSSRSMSPSKGSSHSRHSTPATQYTQTRSLVKRSNDNWASDQEAKVRLMNIPKFYWTKDVYLAMCRYGTVVKIEMIIGSRGNDAIVTLQ